METHWTPSQITTSVLGVLGFILSAYNYLIVQRRKDKEDRRNRLSDARFRFGQQRQEVMELVTAAQLAVMRKSHVLQDILREAEQAGRQDSVNQLQTLLTKAKAELAEVESRVTELLALTLPVDAKLEVIQLFEEAYSKIIAGLKTEVLARDAVLKDVDRVVEIVKKDIAKAQK